MKKTNDEKTISAADLKISGQRALWGNIPEGLRALSIELRGKIVAYGGIHEVSYWQRNNIIFFLPFLFCRYTPRRVLKRPHLLITHASGQT